MKLHWNYVCDSFWSVFDQFLKNIFENIFSTLWVPHLKYIFGQKTPEMNELEPYKNSLKIWAHNFEKQKS